MAQNRLSGINPQAYQGVEASSPPQFVYFKRDPTPQDYYNFDIGTIWLNRGVDPQRVWILVGLSKHVATWIELLTNAAGAIQFQTADGLQAIPNALGTLFMPGGTLITTRTAPNVNSVEIDVTNGADGQIIIGQGANPPVWGDLTSVGATIAITPDLTGPGTINLDVVGLPGAITYVEDVGAATPAADIINIVGDGVDITTTGAGNTVTISLINAGTTTTYHTDAGNAVPAANILNIFGDGVNIGTTGAGNTVTISFNGSITPYKSAFLYYRSTSGGYLTGDGTILTIVCPSRVFDVNGDFDGTTFTAPRTGIYYFRGQVFVEARQSGGPQTLYLQTMIVTPGRTFVANVTNITNQVWALNQYVAPQEIITSLNAGDHVIFQFSVSGGTKTTGYFSGQGLYGTIFSGFLIG